MREDEDRILTLDIWDMSGKREDVALTSVFYQGIIIILLLSLYSTGIYRLCKRMMRQDRLKRKRYLVMV